MNIQAWAILTTGLADGYELTKSPARVREAREAGLTVVELSPKQELNTEVVISVKTSKAITDLIKAHPQVMRREQEIKETP